MATSREQAKAAKAAVERAYRRFGDIAVGITKVGASYAVKVNLHGPLPAGADAPKVVDGVPVQVEVIGKITPR
jgi:hypothetical protein